MNVYTGIEKVDPTERLIQHGITKTLWQKLCEEGVRKGDNGRIIAYLVSDYYEQAEGLKAQYNDGFEATIFKEDEEDEDSKYIIEIITPVCSLSNEALEELADILMISAVQTNTKFDGFEIDMSEVKKLNTPWWKIW